MAAAASTQAFAYVEPEEAEAFGRRRLLAHGLTEADAATVAQCLETERRKTGVPYGPKELVALQAEAAKAGLPPMRVIETGKRKP